MLHFARACAFSLFHKVFKFNIYSFSSKSLSSFFLSVIFSFKSSKIDRQNIAHQNIDRNLGKQLTLYLGCDEHWWQRFFNWQKLAKIKNWKWSYFQGFQSHKWQKRKVKNHHISLFNFQ